MRHGSVGSSCDLEELRHMGESLRLVLPWVDWLREPGMRNLEAVAELAPQLIFFGGESMENLWKPFMFFYVSHVFFSVYECLSSFFLYKMARWGVYHILGPWTCVIECGIQQKITTANCIIDNYPPVN
jgi:hypothetical protein